MNSPDDVLPCIMRPLMGMVSRITSSISEGLPALLIAFIPRSDNARLIDFVKLRGVVEGSLRSAASQDK